MKKRMLSLALAAVTLMSSLGGYAFAKEDVPVMETEESQVQQSETAVETAGESEKASEAETETKETETKETEDEPKLIVSFEPADYEAEIGFKDYMQKGGEDYLISQLPDTVMAVYEDMSSGEVEASWLPEKPFGSEGSGKYVYRLDISKYALSEAFDSADTPKAVLYAKTLEKRFVNEISSFAVRASGGIYDEQLAAFSHAGGLESADYGYNSTQYFNISFDGKKYTGFCGKASYIAPNAGKYYVHEIPGGTRESDIVKAILLTNPLTGPYPDNTWNTIADKKFTDKMLWSVHPALSVYWSADEYGSAWIRVNAIQEMGNYLYDEWIPAHRDIMDSTHAYYLCASPKPHVSDNFGGKCPSGKQDVLFLSDEVTPQDGGLKLKKMSANPGITEGNSCYSLAGAEYGVYTDRGCTNQVGTLTTNASGESNTISVQAGKYYVKEIKAPQGFLIDKNIHEKVVTAEETAVIEVYDGPANDPAAIELTKIDANGNKVPSLAGAQFTIKYYDGYYTKNNLPGKAKRTWVLETKPVKYSDGSTHYICVLSDTYKVGGDDFYLENGYPSLPLGTITIEETKAPQGYVLEGGYLQVPGSNEKFTGKYVAQIKQIGDLAKLTGGNKFTVSDYSTNIQVNKIDSKTGKGLAGAKLRVTDRSGKVVDEWVSDGNPHTMDQLVVGETYTMTEVSVPNGYATAEPVKFTVKDTQKVQTVVMKDAPTIKQINKVDSKTGKGLAGATLRVTDASGKVIDEWVSDGNPHTIERLIAGHTYTLTEVKVPDGYVTASPVKFTVKDTGEVQGITMKDEQTTFDVNKVDENGKGLAGATLRVTDKDNKTVDEWVSDGKAHEIKKLIVGHTYTLTEVKVPDGYVTASPVKFTVKDTEEVQTVTMKNIESRMKINKLDKDTGKGLPGAKLRVVDKDDKTIDEWVSDGKAHEIKGLIVGETYMLIEAAVPEGYVTADPVEFTVRDTQEVQTVTMKDDGTELEVVKTDAETGDYVAGATLAVYPVDKDGKVLEGECVETFLTTDKPHKIEHITIGRYVLRELVAPFDNGYVTAEDVFFEVKDTPELQKVEMKDDFTKVDVLKTDIETGEAVAGATLAVYPVSDDGEVLEGECVETFLTTDKPHRIERITVGKYVLRELVAPFDAGYVTAEDVYFEVKDTPEVHKVEMKDDFTKVEILKVDAETGEPVPDAELAVYVADENGKADEEKCVETFLTTTEPHCIERIPTGSYVLRELKAPHDAGYVTAADIVFTVDDTPKTVAITMEDDFSKVEISKKDITNDKELPGAHLKVTDSDGTVVDEWVSTDEPHLIERLKINHLYVLHETLPADGYATANDVEFILDDTGKVQSVEMKDDITKIEIIKTDEKGRHLKGATLRVTDASGKVIDEWVSDGQPHRIDKLFAGKEYILEEIKVPEGYVRAAPVKFTVKDTAELQIVTMIDKQIPESPKTGDSFNPFVAVGVTAVLAAVIVVIVWIKKKKK